MHKVQYIVKGTPVKDIDINAQILAFLSEFGLEGALKEKADGFVLQAKGKAHAIKRFEKGLLQKLITLFDLQSYTKKIENNHNKAIKNSIPDNKTEIQIAADLLRKSKVLAVKAENGYHIICHASKIPAIKTLRQIIREERKPLTVIFKSIISTQKLVLLSKKEKEFLSRDDAPVVVAKIKTLHQMERNKYKYTLSGYINPINKRVPLSLPSDPFYEALFKEVQFPIVSIDATTPAGDMITDKEELIAVYGDQFAHIIEESSELTTPETRDFFQFVYGRLRPFYPRCQQQADVMLTTSQSKIFDHTLAPFKIVLDENQNEQPLYTALSMLFSHSTPEEIVALQPDLSRDEIGHLYQQWQKDQNTKITTSLLSYYDAIAGLSALLKEKAFETESLMVAEAYFEVCEEDLFTYTIDNRTIKLDIVTDFHKNQKPKHLFSTLTNTISTIIARLASDTGKTSISLCGELFGNRDLTELTIEKLEDAEIEAIY